MIIEGTDDGIADCPTDGYWEDILEGTLEGSVVVIGVDLLEGVVEGTNNNTAIGRSDGCNIGGEVGVLDRNPEGVNEASSDGISDG